MTGMQQEQCNCDRNVAGHCNRDKRQQNIATLTGMLQEPATVTGMQQELCNLDRYAEGTNRDRRQQNTATVTGKLQTTQP